MGEEKAEKINVLAKQIETKTFETQDLLKARRLSQAAVKLKEIDRLLKELDSYHVTIDKNFRKVITAFKDVVEGRKTVEELFNVKIAKQGLPEKYVEGWKANEKAILAFANSKIRKGKFKTGKEIYGLCLEIEAFVKAIAVKAGDAAFADWVKVGLYSELYKVIKATLGKSDLSEEMQVAVGRVLDQALVFSGGGGEGGESASAKGPKIDPLFVYAGRLAGKFQLPEVDAKPQPLAEELFTGEDFLEGIEEEAMPKDVLDDLNATLEELGDKVRIANPWQEALLNLFAVYVIKPVYQKIKESADIGIVRYPVRKILLSLRNTITTVFAAPETSVEMVKSVINSMRVVTAGLSDFGIKLLLDAKFNGAADLIIKMVQAVEESDVAGNLGEILRRNPKRIAEERLNNPRNITRLSALTYLLFKLKEENRENKTLLIGIQFAIQILIRLRDDSELLTVSPVIKRNMRDLFARYKSKLTEIPFAKDVGEDEIETILGMILPDNVSAGLDEKVEPGGELNYKKIEKFIVLIEDLLVKDPEKYSKYNAVLVCLMENIREYLHRPNAKQRLLRDFATLQRLIRDVAKEKVPGNPFVKLVFKHPELVYGTITTLYKQPDAADRPGGISQLRRLKTALEQIAKENAGDKTIVDAMELGRLLLDGFASDRDFFAHIAQFEEVLDTVFFGRKFANLRVSGEARAALKSIIGYVPIERKEPDIAVVSRIADAFGSFEDFAGRPVAELQERAMVLVSEVPDVLKLNYALAGLGEGLKALAGKMAGEKFGVKERALFDYLFANYRDYLCDKYGNDIEKFLLEVKAGDPPEIELKIENIEKEALVLAKFGAVALAKIGIPKVAAMIRSNLVTLANAAKARLLKRKRAA